MYGRWLCVSSSYPLRVFLLALSTALVLAAVFGSAGISKLRAPLSFRSALRDVVPGLLVRPVATLIPLGELLVAGALLSGFVPREAGIASFLLLVLFSLALGRMWLVGATLNCGCFGESSDASTPATGLIRNALLMIAGSILVVSPGPSPSWSASAGEIVGSGTVSLGAVCLWLCGSGLVIRRQLVGAIYRVRDP